ncbi:MAG: alpha/beta fold hydrolase [Pseudomonadota bacterium]
MALLVLASAGLGRAQEIEACPAPPAVIASAAEREFSIDTPDGRIAGTLAVPVDAAPRALALLLHGYTGARNEIPVAGGEGMFARTARRFAALGIATLRIDFIGSGRSDGDWADTRFSTQARDAARAARALRVEFAGSDLSLGVLGYSQGGLVALRAAAAAQPFDRLALWNPVMDPMATYGVIFGRETILEAADVDADGEANAPFGETRLRPGFFAELVAADPIADAALVEAPVLIVTGQRDPLVKGGAALAGRIRDARAGDTAIVDLDAGHDLGAIREPMLLDAVIDCTASFLLGTRPN